MVFDNFVFHNAHPAFLGGHLRQRNAQRTHFQGDAFKNFVNLLLRIGGKNLLCGAYFADQVVNIFFLVKNIVFRRFNFFFLQSHFVFSIRLTSKFGIIISKKD